MLRATRQSPGGIAAKAIAGIELALLDLKARALGVSVAELFGGPTRDEVRLYWSHCGTSRVLLDGLLDTPPLVDMAAVADLGREVVAAGYDALKTNVLIPGDPATVYMPGFSAGPGSTDQTADNAMLAHIDTLIGTLRDAVGPEVDLCLDLNFNFKTRGGAAHRQTAGALSVAVAGGRHVPAAGAGADPRGHRHPHLQRREPVLYERLSAVFSAAGG